MVIRFILTVFLCSCTTVVIEYPSVCPDGQPKCQRNLDAQTLSIIGKEKAALTKTLHAAQTRVIKVMHEGGALLVRYHLEYSDIEMKGQLGEGAQVFVTRV